VTSSTTSTVTCPPSAARTPRVDFEPYELVPILNRFTTGWGDLPALIPGVDDYRVLRAGGHLAHAHVVHGQLTSAGAVELLARATSGRAPACRRRSSGMMRRPVRARSLLTGTAFATAGAVSVVMELRAYGCTHAGHERALNEDSLLVADPAFVVADGMGGHAAGEVASGLAVSAFAELAGAGPVVPQRAVDLVAEANRRVVDAVLAAPELAGMGTTLAGLVRVVNGPREEVLVLNVGDSRVYRLRRGRLEQLTTDHSAVQELVSAGRITRAEAARHAQRNIVTRALGVEGVTPDVWFVDVEPGDRFVLATDGLTGEVDDEELAALCAANEQPQAAAEALVAGALLAGGRDNVTVVVVDVTTGSTEEVETTAPRSALEESDEDPEATKPRLGIHADDQPSADGDQRLR